MNLLQLIFLVLSPGVAAGVLDISISENGQFDSDSDTKSIELYPNDLIVFYFNSPSPSNALSLVEMEIGSCTPKSGGYSFASSTPSSSVFIDFENAGNYEFSTVEHCSVSDPAKRLSVSIVDLPVNPYHAQVSKLLNQIKIEKKLDELKRSSASSHYSKIVSSLGFSSSILIILSIY